MAFDSTPTRLTQVFQRHNPEAWQAQPVVEFIGPDCERHIAVLFGGGYWLAKLELMSVAVSGERGSHKSRRKLQWTPYYGPIPTIDFATLRERLPQLRTKERATEAAMETANG